MHRFIHFSCVFALVFIGSLGCGDDKASATEDIDTFCAKVPGCTNEPLDPNTPMLTLLRIEVVRDVMGQVRLGNVTELEVPADNGRPISTARGEYLLVGYDKANQPIAYQTMAFPSVLIEESLRTGGEPKLRDITQDTWTSVVFLPKEDVETIQLIDPMLNVVDDQPAQVEGALRVIGQGLSLTNKACSHVRVITPNNQKKLQLNKEELIVEQPSAIHIKLMSAALNQMTPLMCHGISRIALVSGPYFERDAAAKNKEGAVETLQAGDLIVINANMYNAKYLNSGSDAQMWFMAMLFHEGTHATKALIHDRGLLTAEAGGKWTVAAAKDGDHAVSRLRLAKGLEPEWLRLHNSFINAGWAVPYNRNAFSTPDALVQQGFMSRYGRTTHGEDLAEMVAHVKMRGIFNLYKKKEILSSKDPMFSNMPEDLACRIFRKQGWTYLPGEYSAIYAKLRMITQLGLITQQEFDTCVGKIKITQGARGLTFSQGGPSFVFGSQVKASITQWDDDYVFRMESRGKAKYQDKQYDAKATVLLKVGTTATPLDAASWPRGRYELGENKSTIIVELDGKPEANYEVYKGHMYIYDSDEKQINGVAIISQTYESDSPDPTINTYDPPLVVKLHMTP